jgi:hypothetical protein
MKQLLGSLLGGVAALLLKEYRRLSIDWVRIRAAICYVQGVKAARKGFLAGLLLAFCLLLGGSGFVLFHVGIFLLLPHAWRPAVFMGLGSIYMIVVLLLLRWMCAEKTWMEYSNAGKYVAAATEKQSSRPS